MFCLLYTSGCCAQMVGFAVMSFRENRWGGILSQGIGTSMLQMGNIVKNPKIWIPPIITSMITCLLYTSRQSIQNLQKIIKIFSAAYIFTDHGGEV